MQEKKYLVESVPAPPIVLLLIVLGGFALRIWAVTWGLPLLLHPDEPTFVRIAMHFGSGDLNPHWFGNPGNIFMYFLFFCYSLVYIAGYILGEFSNPEAFLEYYRFSPTIFYMIGRVTAVLLGTASIYLVYKIVARFKSRIAGLVAALFLATSPLHVEHSKYIRIDIISTFFVLLTIFFCLRLLESRKRIDYMMAGVGAGLALAAKYPTGAVIATVMLAFAIVKFEMFTEQKNNAGGFFRKIAAYIRALIFDRNVLIGVACIFATFAITTPFFFLDYKKALQDLVYEVSTPHVGAEKESLLSNLWWYAAGPMREEGFNAVLVLCAFGGIIWLIAEKNKKAAIVISFFVIYFLMAGLAASKFSRWIIPLLPLLAIFSAVFLTEIFYRITNRMQVRRLAPIVFPIIIGLLALPQAAQSIDRNYRLTKPDTRTLCKAWVEQNLPPDSRIAQEEYTYLPTPETSYMLGDAEVNGYYILQKISLGDTSFAYYQENDFDYILISSRGSSRFGQLPKYRPFYDELSARGKLLKTFQADGKEILGPLIQVFEIPADNLNGATVSGGNAAVN